MYKGNNFIFLNSLPVMTFRFPVSHSSGETFFDKNKMSLIIEDQNMEPGEKCGRINSEVENTLTLTVIRSSDWLTNPDQWESTLNNDL